MRSEPRHFVYSKECWVALDRAVTLADSCPSVSGSTAWEATRDEIAAAILEQGWSDTVGAFTQSFGSDELDASNLMIPIVGFLPPTTRGCCRPSSDRERLTDERGLVYRYRVGGRAGGRGGHVPALHVLARPGAGLSGQTERAREVFDRAAAFVNDVGLLAEEVDPHSGELLGNFPQAFSHIGLVNAAWAISEAESRPD